jgi:hypothetical protein
MQLIDHNKFIALIQEMNLPNNIYQNVVNALEESTPNKQTIEQLAQECNNK